MHDDDAPGGNAEQGDRDIRSAAAWSYHAYSLDTEADVFGPLSPMVALWRSKFLKDDTPPKWRDFDILEFEDWWGQLSLAEIHRDPFDLRWVLWGTKLVKWWGEEYTNQFVSQQPYLGETWERNERPYLENLADGRLIGFVTGTLAPQQRDFVYLHGVDLPLMDDGKVTHFLSAYKLRDGQEAFLPNAKAVFEA